MEGKGDERINEFLDSWDERLVAAGEEPIGDKVRAEALYGQTTGGEDGLAATARLLREEIAGIRYVLRNAYARAMETEELSEYVRLVGIYGMGCVRLVRLMKMEASSTQGRLEAYWHAAVDKALRELVEEMGLTRGLDEG